MRLKDEGERKCMCVRERGGMCVREKKRESVCVCVIDSERRESVCEIKR